MTGNPAAASCRGAIQREFSMPSFKLAATSALALITALSPAVAQVAALGTPEGQVNIVAWPGYIERGETDAAYDWVTKFEKETGCKVNAKTANTSDEMVALMNGGGFDLVTASGDASLRLVAGGKVQPINTALIPSWSKVDKRLQDAAWHTVNGVHYGVPYQWGPNVLMYNTDVFKEAPKSWNVVFEKMDLPDGKSNEGRVQAYDGPIYIADAALYLMAHKPELGIKDPYELTADQYAAALDLLRGQRALVSRYWHDATVQTDDFKNEGIVASTSWPYQVNLLLGEKAPISSTIPEEGATGWADTTMMAADAANPTCSYLWMEHTLNSNLQSDVSVWFGSNPVVPEACTDKSGLQTAEGCAANGIDTFDKISFWKTPVADCEQGAGACVPYATWVSDYIGIVGGN
jgi:putative spermidine/putrescine transport system substrate-binding protein